MGKLLPTAWCTKKQTRWKICKHFIDCHAECLTLEGIPLCREPWSREYFARLRAAHQNHYEQVLLLGFAHEQIWPSEDCIQSSLFFNDCVCLNKSIFILMKHGKFWLWPREKGYFLTLNKISGKNFILFSRKCKKRRHFEATSFIYFSLVLCQGTWLSTVYLKRYVYAACQLN